MRLYTPTTEAEYQLFVCRLHIGRRLKFSRLVILIIFVFALLPDVLAQDSDTVQADPNALKGLSLEELMDLQVYSVSRRREPLSEAASAIQVIPGDDIPRYGATNIPEALYLAGNLQVAQRNAHAWSISARGFNTELANKLLVLMDGRTLYTPLFSGVFWGRENYLLEDINRIEVISGPGGTLWGANAVNGVISIITKSSEETQGLFLKAGAGNELEAQVAGRYGGKLGESTYFRVYGQYGQRDGSYLPDSTGAKDQWKVGRGGFRIDSWPKQELKLTLQGDVYQALFNQLEGGEAENKGGYLLGRATYTFEDSSSMMLRTYYDRGFINDETAALVIDGNEVEPAGMLKDDLTTFDMEFHHRFTIGSTNRIVWGIGYRFLNDRMTNAPSIGFVPEDFKGGLFSVFIQDEIELMNDLYLIAGTKLENHYYSGWLLEPNARLRWKIAENRILWAAVSRALRAPSRVDTELRFGSPPNFLLLMGNPDFQNETLIAYESGFRTHLGSSGSGSISLFFNQYDDIRSAVRHPETIVPITFDNGLEGETYGFEFALTYQVYDWWRLFASGNFLKTDIRIKEGATDVNNGYNEIADPEWQFSLRSSLQLSNSVSINPAFRWVDEIQVNDGGELYTVPAYAELDGSIRWQATEHLAISVAGRNLLHKYHAEYDPPGAPQLAIQRSVYGKISVKF